LPSLRLRSCFVRTLAEKAKADKPAAAGDAKAGEKKAEKKIAVGKKGAGAKQASGFIAKPEVPKAPALPPKKAKPPRPIVTLHCDVRPESGKYAARALREVDRVPGVIVGNAKNASLPISIDRKTLESEWRKGGFTNRVYLLQVAGYPQPFKAIPDRVRVTPVGDLPINVSFVQKTSAPHKVNMPIQLLRVEENETAKKGAVFNQPNWTIPCWWSGGDYIPEAINIDVANMKLHDTIQTKSYALPTGLSLREPKEDYVLVELKEKGKDDD